MPTYQGGKARIGNQIFKAILRLEKGTKYEGKTYFEPFCGLAGVGLHFATKTPERKVELCDKNKDLILMLKKLQKGWIPPLQPCTKEKYDSLFESKKGSKTKKGSRIKNSAEKGFYSISCAYSGIIGGGFRVRDSKGNNFYKRARDGLIKLGKQIENTKILVAKDYTKFSPRNKVIYVDPPYKGNNFRNEFFKDFDHVKFWETMRKWSKNNLVFISEYTAPKDFKVVWTKKISVVHSSNTRNKVEKLFMLKG